MHYFDTHNYNHNITSQKHQQEDALFWHIHLSSQHHFPEAPTRRCIILTDTLIITTSLLRVTTRSNSFQLCWKCASASSRIADQSGKLMSIKPPASLAGPMSVRCCVRIGQTDRATTRVVSDYINKQAPKRNAVSFTFLLQLLLVLTLTSLNTRHVRLET